MVKCHRFGAVLRWKILIAAQAPPAPIRSAATSPHSALLPVAGAACRISIKMPREAPYRNAPAAARPLGRKERYASPVATAIAPAWFSLSHPNPVGAEPAGSSASQMNRSDRAVQRESQIR